MLAAIIQVVIPPFSIGRVLLSGATEPLEWEIGKGHPTRSALSRDLISGGGAVARDCEVCGKGPQMGNRVQTRGKAKYLGGVGTKLTGITRRQFKPNLQRVRVTTPQGTNKRMLVCTQCLRSGAVIKRIQAAAFALPVSSE